MINNNNNNNRATFQFSDDDDEMTRLTLRYNPGPTTVFPPPLPPPQLPMTALHPLDYHFDMVPPLSWPHTYDIQSSPPPPLPLPLPQPHQRAARRRAVGCGPPTAVRSRKDETVTPPFPWSEPRRAMVCSLDRLSRLGIVEISGTLQCKRCERRFEEVFDVRVMFEKLKAMIGAKKQEMRDRAPSEWLYPTLPRCAACGEENAARPVIAEKKRGINWLFLLLSGLLGCCTLEQLKYFCKHTGNHRTGAKDRVLYLAYLSLCNQLEPSDLFDPHRR